MMISICPSILCALISILPLTPRFQGNAQTPPPKPADVKAAPTVGTAKASKQDSTSTLPCCKPPEAPKTPVKTPALPQPKSTFVVYPKEGLPKCVDPAKFATDFASVFPGVNSIKKAGPEKVIFLLDSTPDKDGKPPKLDGLEKEIDAVVGSLEKTCSGMGMSYFVYPAEPKIGSSCPASPGKAFALSRPSKGDEHLDYAAWPVISPATLNQWKGAIPGVKDILPASCGRFLFVISKAPDPGDPSPSRNIKSVEDNIRKVVDEEYIDLPEPFVISLPPGVADAASIAKLLDGRIHNASILPSDTTRLLVTPAPDDAGSERRKQLREEIQGLVNDLAAPDKGYSPDVTGQLTRLYYLRDATGLAAVLNNALPDVTAAAVGSDSIMLSSAIAGGQGDRGPGYGDQGRNREAIKAGRRLIAQMDQPHAAVSLFAWSLQISHKEPNDAKTLKEENDKDKDLQKVHSIATSFNNLVSQSVGAVAEALRALLARHYVGAGKDTLEAGRSLPRNSRRRRAVPCAPPS